MTRDLGRTAPLRRAAALWRSAALALAVVLLATTPAVAASADALEPLLRALSIRPWWGDPPTPAMTGLDGQRHSVAELKGRVALLYFWATWCPVCSKELPSEIESLHRAFAERGLVVWAVSFREAPDRVAAWLEQHPISVPALIDPEGVAATAFRAAATPSFVLVDRAGQLVGRGAGPRDWSGEEGRALIRALLDQR